MKSNVFRLFLMMVVLFAGSAMVSDARAQIPPDYSVHWIPAEFEDVQQDFYIQGFAANTISSPQVAFAVGRYRHPDSPLDWPSYRGFVYDHFGTMDTLRPGHFYRFEDLDVEFPPVWMLDATRAAFFDCNTFGRIGGLAVAADGTVVACYLDLFPEDSSGNPLPRKLKRIDVPGATGSTRAWKVNQYGDILVTGREINPHIFNPDTGEMIRIPVSAGTESVSFNDVRELAGVDLLDTVFRHRTGTGETEYFPDLDLPNGGLDGTLINNFGEFVARKKIKRRWYGVRVNAAGVIDWISDKDRRAGEINDSGDVLLYGTDGKNYLYHEGFQQSFEIKSLVQNPDPLFAASNYNGILGNRDSSGFPWIMTRLDSNGDGFVLDGALLMPSAPMAGIKVTPTSGLVTTKDGGTDSFDVVLQTQPTADANVTIGISSSDVSAGTVNKASLTFTPTNWDIPQTVTVTGVDDLIEDGDVAYTIVTAAAVSDDEDYNGLDADDVQVTNLDNDGPLTYHNEDTPLPLSIPDNDQDGVSSDIDVPDNFQITGLTVTLDISHQRPSDLVVYLYGPDAIDPVQLFNFSGGNHVADFNDSHTFGRWTLEVYDTRRNRIGTLNSWSITVDRP